jgi:hypothetical protein
MYSQGFSEHFTSYTPSFKHTFSVAPLPHPSSPMAYHRDAPRTVLLADERANGRSTGMSFFDRPGYQEHVRTESWRSGLSIAETPMSPHCAPTPRSDYRPPAHEREYGAMLDTAVSPSSCYHNLVSPLSYRSAQYPTPFSQHSHHPGVPSYQPQATRLDASWTLHHYGSMLQTSVPLVNPSRFVSSK